MSETIVQLIVTSAAEPSAVAAPAPASEPLDAVSLADVLGKLPPLAEAQTSEFVLRKSTAPPPRIGEDIRQPIGAVGPDESDTERPTVDRVAAKVTRITPSGEVDAAAKLTISFDRPVVPLGWEGTPPIELHPPIAGRWRALGTSTLVLEPEDRLPGSTHCRITVAAGAQFDGGVEVGEPAAAELTTATLTLLRGYPQQALAPREQAIVVLQFDQRIDPEAVAAHIRSDVSLAVVASDLEALRRLDANAATFVERARPGTWLAVQTSPLKPGDVTLQLPAGAPSLEGPLTSREAQSFRLQVAGLFTATPYSTEVNPEQNWTMSFTNTVDLGTIDSADFEISPPPEGEIRVYGHGRTLDIMCKAAGDTQYLLRLPASLRDVHGQQLSGNREFVIQTTEAYPALFGGYAQISTVLSDAPRQIAVHATNLQRLDVAVYEVEPDDWFRYIDWLRARNDAPPPGRLIGERAIDVASQSRGASTRINVDVGWALPPGTLGHRIVNIRPTPSNAGRSPIHPSRVWLQSTNLGLSAWAFQQTLELWVTDLATGEARPGCTVHSLGEGRKTTSEPTDVNGGVELMTQPTYSVLVAADGDDTCMLPIHPAHVGPTHRALVGHVFDDRGMYRPEETVTLTGWARSPVGRYANELEVVTGPARLTVRDRTGTEIVSCAVQFDEQGRFEATVTLPAEPNLGEAYVDIEVPGRGTLHHEFQIQEFRRPEYEVTVSVDNAGPHLVGDDIVVTAEARYYSGEALGDAETDWDVSARPTSYSPPGWHGFVFGKRVYPWFGWHSVNTLSFEHHVEGRTNAAGTHRVSATVPTVEPPQAVVVTAAAKVTDVNRQTWAASVSALVHPSSIYVGVRAASAFVAAADEVVVDVVATTIDGEVVTGRQLVAVLERGQSRQVRGTWSTEWTEVDRATVTSTAEPASARLMAQTSGSHRVVVTTADTEDRIARTTIDLWVSGAPRERVGDVQLTIIPREAIIEAPANTEFAIAAGFATGHGRWFLLHHDVVTSGRFELESGSAQISIPIGGDLLPRVKLFATVVGVDDDGVPALSSGSVDVPVWDRHRRLDVDVTADPPKTEPGSRATLTIAAMKPDGTPAAGAHAIVWVVDEAVLALSSYETPDPVNSLYPRPDLFFQSHQSRNSILRPPSSPDEGGNFDGAAPPGAAGAPMLRQAGAAFGGGGAAEPQPVAVRTNFEPLAAFVGDVVMDDVGRAVVDLDLPDSLTRYRVMANVHLGAGLFGCGESSLTARLPLMVRPSPPRFANFGDRFELAVVVQNATNARCDVDVAVRASNLELTHGDHDGRRVTLAADERAEVRFPARTVAPGEVTFDVVADTVSSVDAAAGRLPVYSPATTEAAATYGVIDDGVSEHVITPPANAVRQFGGLEVTTTSTALQALTDAVLYLATYPYDCAEQRASRILSIAALRDVLAAFEAVELPSPDALEASVRTDLQALVQRQNADGGWGFWARGESWPIVSIHAVHALVAARNAGFEVRPDALGRALAYLDQIERHLNHERFDRETRLTLRAYTSFVYTRAGVDDARRALAVVSDAGSLDSPPLAAAAWCLAVLHGTPTGEVLTNFALNRVSETESTAVFAADVDRGGAHLMLGSERRTDAVLLWALMDARPDSPLIPKIVHGLLAHRKRGRWGSTQENAHVLLSLDRYFKKYEALTPDFVARAWLGDRAVGEHHFEGRTTARHHAHVPMEHLAGSGPTPLLLQKDGAGRMYYRVGLRYALEDVELTPVDRGFVVDRRYEAVDGEDDVGRRDDGTWVVRAGARVRVTVSMLAPVRRHHVALVDPYPAGFEPLNPAMAVTATLPDTPSATDALFPAGGRAMPWFSRWHANWFEHQNLRDDRAEAFASTLWEGHHEYVYYARATTIGEFVVPPAKAEEMYSPEVFGRGGSDRVVVIEM